MHTAFGSNIHQTKTAVVSSIFVIQQRNLYIEIAEGILSIIRLNLDLDTYLKTVIWALFSRYKLKCVKNALIHAHACDIFIDIFILKRSVFSCWFVSGWFDKIWWIYSRKTCLHAANIPHFKNMSSKDLEFFHCMHQEEIAFFRSVQLILVNSDNF